MSAALLRFDRGGEVHSVRTRDGVLACERCRPRLERLVQLEWHHRSPDRFELGLCSLFSTRSNTTCTPRTRNGCRCLDAREPRCLNSISLEPH